jgi:Ni,Fe-hydrogenase III small subunit/ferredoxin
MAWVLRGLREGVVTTRYPRQADGYAPSYRGVVAVLGRGDVAGHVASVCPTGAISVGDEGARLDRGGCILCGRCVDLHPDLFGFSPSFEASALERRDLVVPSAADVRAVRSELASRVRALRRSVHIRHVDAGSDGSEEWEVAALTNPIYDVQRLGIFFTASPRHADLLLVTGVGTSGMEAALRTTYEAMPEPRVVLAAGVDAIGGGLIGPTYVGARGVGEIVPVDVWVPGSPPSPFGLLHGILTALGLLADRAGPA